MEALNLAELPILDFINRHIGNAFFDAVMPIITLFGEGGVFWIAAAVVMIMFKKTRKTGLMLGAALLLGFIVGNMIMKPCIARPRPYTYRDISLLISEQRDYSFPSGHTLACFEAATVLMIRNKKFGIGALIIAILVAFSRMYLFVHYPTDILGGIVLGVLFGILGCLLINYIVRKFNLHNIIPE